MACRAVRIGTDCSGIESPVQALKDMDVRYEHVWSCEQDPFARKSLLANFKPAVFFDDVLERDHSKLPDIDIYVCGFPCQPFSSMGKKAGTRDKRWGIMAECIKVINEKKVFILENVQNFRAIENGVPYKMLMKSLADMHIYNVHVDMYNTREYGLPQNRERLYIVGISKLVSEKQFLKPTPQHHRQVSIEHVLLDRQVHNNRSTYSGPSSMRSRKQHHCSLFRSG